MGWWWGKDSQAQPTYSISKPQSPPPEPPSTQELTDKPTTSISQDAQWEEEMKRFLQPTAEPSQGQAQTTPPASTDTASTVTSASTQHPPLDDRLLTSERLYPDTMTCRAAFDRAFYCQSVGGQFNNLYRHGGLRDCHDNWAEFWFCMRIRGRSGESKKQRVREFYAERDARYREGPSSEDVWEKRTTMLDKAFDMDPERSAQEGA